VTIERGPAVVVTDVIEKLRRSFSLLCHISTSTLKILRLLTVVHLYSEPSEDTFVMILEGWMGGMSEAMSEFELSDNNW
jgi:hypothetical protein